MGKLQAIGKVHIKDIKVLKEWHASGEFKKWDKGNWSPSCAASNRIKWEDTDQIGFYQMQERIPELSKSLDRTDSWIGELLEMAEYLQSIGQSLNLLYLDDQNRFAVISGADTEEAYTLPCRFLEIEEYKDYSDYAPDQMCSIAGETLSSIIPAGQGFSSVTDVKKDIYGKEEELKEQETALKKLQQEQEEKLEEMKRQLMEQYRPGNDREKTGRTGRGEEKTGKSAYGTGYTDLCHQVYHRRGCRFHAACHRQACRYRRPGCDLPKTPLHGRGAWKVPGIV